MVGLVVGKRRREGGRGGECEREGEKERGRERRGVREREGEKERRKGGGGIGLVTRSDFIVGLQWLRAVEPLARTIA